MFSYSLINYLLFSMFFKATLLLYILTLCSAAVIQINPTTTNQPSLTLTLSSIAPLTTTPRTTNFQINRYVCPDKKTELIVKLYIQIDGLLKNIQKQQQLYRLQRRKPSNQMRRKIIAISELESYL